MVSEKRVTLRDVAAAAGVSRATAGLTTVACLVMLECVNCRAKTRPAAAGSGRFLVRGT